MSGRRESILISDVSPQKSKAVFICPILKEMAQESKFRPHYEMKSCRGGKIISL